MKADHASEAYLDETFAHCEIDRSRRYADTIEDSWKETAGTESVQYQPESWLPGLREGQHSPRGFSSEPNSIMGHHARSSVYDVAYSRHSIDDSQSRVWDLETSEITTPSEYEWALPMISHESVIDDVQLNIWDLGTSANTKYDFDINTDAIDSWPPFDTRSMRDTRSLRASSVSSALTSERSTGGGVLMCQFLGCVATFTGRYAKGNLGRHWRQKHRAQELEEYSCEVDGCYRRFQRKDSRRKHYKKYHPHLIAVGVSPLGIQRKQHTAIDVDASSSKMESLPLSYPVTETRLVTCANPALVERITGPEESASCGPSEIHPDINSDQEHESLELEARTIGFSDIIDTTSLNEADEMVIAEDRRNCCTLCENKFQRPADLRRHMQQHEEPLLACDVLGCERNFHRVDKLRDHVRQAHKGDVATEEGILIIQMPPEPVQPSSTHLCLSCNLVFQRESQLNQHIARKHIRRYQCNECDKAFNLNADLERHKKTRHNSAAEALFKCSEAGCSLTFTRQDNLQRHLRRIHGCEDASHTALLGPGAGNGGTHQDPLKVTLEDANTTMVENIICTTPESRSL